MLMFYKQFMTISCAANLYVKRKMYNSVVIEDIKNSYWGISFWIKLKAKIAKKYKNKNSVNPIKFANF